MANEFPCSKCGYKNDWSAGHCGKCGKEDPMGYPGEFTDDSKPVRCDDWQSDPKISCRKWAYGPYCADHLDKTGHRSSLLLPEATADSEATA